MSAAEFADRHRIPPPSDWPGWVAEVNDTIEGDWRADLILRYLALL